MSVDPKILELCEKVTAKRPRTVIDFILKHGQVTTDDLLELGYAHAPRAARDVREQGVPLDTISVTNEKTGRRMAAYVFGDPAQIKAGRIGGRKAFSKPFKEKLLAYYDSREAFTNEKLDGRYLQIDHRVPYEVAGDSAQHEGEPFGAAQVATGVLLHGVLPIEGVADAVVLAASAMVGAVMGADRHAEASPVARASIIRASAGAA